MLRGRWRLRRSCGRRVGHDVETMWSEDGFVLRFPETDEAPRVEAIMLEPEEAAELVLRQLGSTALVCGEVSRERGAGVVAAEEEGGWADSAVAAEEAGV